MTRRGAALAAGYSERCADNVAYDVEGKRRGRFSVMRQFIRLLNADPDIPVLKQAKAEHAKLQ